MSEQTQETLFMLLLFAGGGLAGQVVRWATLSGWVALLLPLVLAPLGIGLTLTFC